MEGPWSSVRLGWGLPGIILAVRRKPGRLKSRLSRPVFLLCLPEMLITYLLGTSTSSVTSAIVSNYQ